MVQISPKFILDKVPTGKIRIERKLFGLIPSVLVEYRCTRYELFPWKESPSVRRKQSGKPYTIFQKVPVSTLFSLLDEHGSTFKLVK